MSVYPDFCKISQVLSFRPKIDVIDGSDETSKIATYHTGVNPINHGGKAPHRNTDRFLYCLGMGGSSAHSRKITPFSFNEFAWKVIGLEKTVKQRNPPTLFLAQVLHRKQRQVQLVKRV